MCGVSGVKGLRLCGEALAWCRLGWLPGTAAIGILTALTAYSGFLISRLVHAVSGAILFGDIGEAAAGPKV